MVGPTQRLEELEDLAAVHCAKILAHICLFSQGNDAHENLLTKPAAFACASMSAGSLWHTSCLECLHSSLNESPLQLCLHQLPSDFQHMY